MGYTLSLSSRRSVKSLDQDGKRMSCVKKLCLVSVYYPKKSLESGLVSICML